MRVTLTQAYFLNFPLNPTSPIRQAEPSRNTVVGSGIEADELSINPLVMWALYVIYSRCPPIGSPGRRLDNTRILDSVGSHINPKKTGSLLGSLNLDQLSIPRLKLVV